MTSHTYSPIKGELCMNSSCVKYRQLNKIRRDKYLERGQSLLETFLDQEDVSTHFNFTSHATKRCVERAINTRRLLEIVVADGFAVDCNTDNESIVVHGCEKIDKGKYRHLHVVLQLDTNGPYIEAKVVTVFDPKASSHLYNDSLDFRVCWCQPHELDAWV